MALMQPLHDEHEELLPYIERLRVAGDAVGATTASELSGLLDSSVDFLVHQLIPHATAEDKVLYPVVQKVMGAAEATATMSRDHVEVDRLTHELRDLRDDVAAERVVDDDAAARLRRVLYGLYALVRTHFAKEEEVYLPLLEARLSTAEATDLFQRMHASAVEVKANVR